MSFARFMATTAGRGLRIAVGLAMIAVGLLAVEGDFGALLALAGVAPLLAGVFNVCLLAPLLNVPFYGSSLSKPSGNRAALGAPRPHP